eukprot:767190-Hanusia_phi.AAC.1
MSPTSSLLSLVLDLFAQPYKHLTVGTTLNLRAGKAKDRHSTSSSAHLPVRFATFSSPSHIILRQGKSFQNGRSVCLVPANLSALLQACLPMKGNQGILNQSHTSEKHKHRCLYHRTPENEKKGGSAEIAEQDKAGNFCAF